MKFTRLLALLLLACMLVGTLASCGGDKDPEPSSSSSATTSGGGSNKVPSVFDDDRQYVYKDAVVTLSNNWNPHTYQTSDESYPIDFITSGLYSFYFNDELHPVAGKSPYDGYVIVPEMAASEPVDVTAQYAGQYNVPAGATAGYAYTIDLNPLAVWQTGEAINAQTYLWSMQQLLNPDYMNYRGVDYFSGDLAIANADKYYYQGSTSYNDNMLFHVHEMAQLTKGADGQYVSAEGNKMHIGVNFALDWLNGYTLAMYVNAYGEEAFGNLDNFATLVAAADENGLVPLTDENLALLSSVTTSNPAWGESDADLPAYFVEEVSYADNFSFDNVGIKATGEYQITLVFDKSLAGFNLLYNLAGNWIVHPETYENSWTFKPVEEGSEEGVWTTTYCTSLETTVSYGPYKMTEFQTDKGMRFERNETWYGYTDGKHVFVDPVDGQTYPMYQTTAIDTQVVAEASTRKLMFLKGQLMGYGLQSEDFDEYRSSDWCFATPGSTIYFFIFNGYMDAIQKREANEGFDKSKFDLETMTLTTFRKAIAVTYDKDLFAATISPARSGALGLIGDAYIYDPLTGARYRDTDQAKLALCEVYGVNPEDFGGDLDAAVDSITGYDPVQAKALFAAAFAEALELGFVTDADNDGKCDQAIEVEYASSAPSDFITQTLDYLNEKLAEVLVGTPFEGKIYFKESAPLGNDWSNYIKKGLSDTVLGGWSGSLMNPFSLSDLYVNPEKQYDANWFNAASITETLTINGEEVTLNLKQWSDALNGAAVTAENGKTYNFGDGIADVEVRLNILAMIETKILGTYDYIPMLLDGGMSLLSKQVYNVIEEYNPVMGRGGITYMRYNFDEAGWAAYVESQGGELKY